MHIAKAVEALGREMGMEGLALDANGCLTLNVGEEASLFVERQQDVLSVCLARSFGPRVADALEKGLALCHSSQNPGPKTGYNLRVGLFRDDIVVCISRLEKQHITAGMLSGAVPFLKETMDRLT